MKRRYKVLWIVLLILAVPLAALAVVLSYESECGPAPAVPSGATTMKAIVYSCYGPPEVLKLADVAKPVPEDDQVLVKVRAAAANPLDWHYMRGEPYLMRLSAGLGAPKDPYMGVDYAGIVEAVGKSVTRFKPGDEVFGVRTGAFGEYVVVGEQRNIVPKPANLTFEQAAAVPVAALTALQALRDKGQLQAGQKVLINGASGGVGTFAVQIAKSMGAEVTGVCSARNVEMVGSIGADHVIDYKTQDYTKGEERYDLIVDNIGNHALRAQLGVLKSGGRLVIVGGPSDDPWLGPIAVTLKGMFLSPFVDEPIIFFISQVTPQDLTFLAQLMQAGKMTPVIDRTFKLRETPEAVAYLETGRARGKVIITME